MGTMAAQMADAHDIADVPHGNVIEEMANLISERLPYFRRIALRRLDNAADAEDAVQDAFLSAWKHLNTFEGQARMSTWLTTIVMNSARMVKRKRRRSLLLSLDGDDENNEDIRLLEMFPDTSPGPEAQVGRRELEDRLGRMLHHLSPNLREVIRLQSAQGLNIREMANALGLTQSAVKNRAARGRKELRKLAACYPARVAGATRPREARHRRRRIPGPGSPA